MAPFHWGLVACGVIIALTFIYTQLVKPKGLRRV